MSLRDRQIGGIPLPKKEGIFLTLLLSLTIPLIGYNLWYPWLGVPEEMWKWIAILCMIWYVASCAEDIPTGVERAQKFLGKYTGISYSAGLCLNPRLPFPIISLVLRLLLSEKILQYLGWTLEGDASIESIITSFHVEGMTSDGIRVTLEGKLTLEVMDVATYLSQRGGGTNKDSIESIISAETGVQLRKKVISKNSAMNLYRGSISEVNDLNQLITEACTFVEDFGLRLSRSPTVSIEIESDRVRRAFDALNAKDIMRANTNELAEAFKDFYARLPKGMSEEVALMMFNAERIEAGLAPVQMNIVKLK